MSKLKVEKHGEDTDDRLFRELKAKRTFLFANRLYVKSKYDEFYGVCTSKGNWNDGLNGARQMNCFCLTSCSFASFKPDTLVKAVSVDPIKVKVKKEKAA